MAYEEEYRNACNWLDTVNGEVNRYSGEVASWTGISFGLVQEIIALNKEIKKREDAIEDIDSFLSDESETVSHVNIVKTQTGTAASNLLNLFHHSDVATKDLEDVFAEEMQRTEACLCNTGSVFDGARTARTQVNTALEDLREQKRNKESERENAEAKIKSAAANVAEWAAKRGPALLQVSYYYALSR